MLTPKQEEESGLKNWFKVEIQFGLSMNNKQPTINSSTQLQWICLHRTIFIPDMNVTVVFHYSKCSDNTSCQGFPLPGISFIHTT